MATLTEIPKTQHAIQLVGPGQFRVNPAKDVVRPGPYEILAKVECVGLCFSDLKLLKQFDKHARKSDILSGASDDMLKGVSSYVPGEKPTVPGHEVTCRIVAVGEKVTSHKVGERCLVQTDYRDLPTANSNAAFGYNFEGGLQEYVLMDERIVVDGNGERFLIPVPENLSASAIALVEPWACVEDSYVNEERTHVKDGGQMLVVVEAGHKEQGIEEIIVDHVPALITRAAAAEVAALANESFDDIVYFGASKSTLDLLNDKLATRGLINVVLGGKKLNASVNVGIGRVHYGMTRWIGTNTGHATESYRHIPRSGELREGESILIIGASGPMGQMHLIRTVCSGVPGVSIVGTYTNDARLAAIEQKVHPLAHANRVRLRMVNIAREKLNEKFSYFAIMAPDGAIVAKSIEDSVPGTIINIFAGIPANVKQEIDLDTYISNQCFMFGTSGSVIRDMKIVLDKVIKGQLDTNLSVDAVSGMAGATEGIAAVENRTLAGKILVYPMLHDLRLTPLSELATKFPTVAAKLDKGKWTRDAEIELLRVAR